MSHVRFFVQQAFNQCPLMNFQHYHIVIAHAGQSILKLQLWDLHMKRELKRVFFSSVIDVIE